jgi:hypothetical protein
MADVLARPLHAGWEESFPNLAFLHAFEAEEWEEEEWEDEDEWDDEGEQMGLGRRSSNADWN